MVVFLYSGTALGFTLSKQTLIGLVNFPVRPAPSPLPPTYFSPFFSLCVASPLTLTFARTMLLYDSWTKKKRVEVKCIHKH
jgi:hypothetical protein